MRTRPLLPNIRHSVMITPISPLHTRLIHIIPSYWTIHRSFEVILECQLEFKSNVPCKSIAWKIHSIWYELY